MMCGKQPLLASYVLLYAVLFIVSVSHAAENLRTMYNDAGIFDPAMETVNVSYQLLRDADEVEVRIEDYQGQVVSRLFFVDLRAGDQSFSWDGRDANDERLPDGRYQLVLSAGFTNGREEVAVIGIRIVTLEKEQRGQVPEPLPPEEHNYKISGSVSGFTRYDKENSDTVGEGRFRTNAEYVTNSYSARATIAAIQDFSGGDPTFNGTQARFERVWTDGKAKGVFRETLGNFNDPMKLFGDFKTERNKVGASVEHRTGNYAIKSLIFTTEGEVNSREQGMAARVTYGAEHQLKIGSSYTLRRAVPNLDTDSRESEHAFGLDVALPLFDSFSLLAQVTGSEGSERRSDVGYQLGAEYDLGQFRLAGGYINLGENFNAPFADPLRGVEGDAQGFEASVDYYQISPILIFRNMAASLRFFSLTRNSDDETVEEMDGSLRFGLGDQDIFFLSVFKRRDENDNNLATATNYTHKWNETYSSGLQLNYSETDSSKTVRTSMNTSRQEGESLARIALEWLEREIDNSALAPYRETNLRIDFEERLWALQLQGKYSEDSEKTGYNLFSKVEYKPVYLHRYNMITYLSVGSRSAVEFEERIEVGLEVIF